MDAGLSFKYILVGDAGVGKSCLQHQFVKREFAPDLQPTLAADVHRMDLHMSGQRVRLEIWDTVGQETYRALTKKYYRDAVVVFLVYDTTQRSSFNHISSWLVDARSLAHEKAIIGLVGNKSDMERQRDVTFEEASLFAEENQLPFLETSAKTGEQVQELFMNAAKSVFAAVKNGSIRLSSPQRQSGATAQRGAHTSGGGNSSGGYGGGGETIHVGAGMDAAPDTKGCPC